MARARRSRATGSVGRVSTGPARDQVGEVAGAQAEPVGVGQPGRLAGVEGAGGGQGLQGVQGRLDPDRGLGAADPELEQLGRPLDVGQPARSQLEVQLRVGPGRQPLGLDPGLHAAHLGHRRRVERVGVDPGLGLGAEPPGQLGVAGHRPHLDQRLQLPRLGPPVPVGQVAAEGPRQRPVAALGTQVGVDLEAGPLGGDGRQAPQQLPDHPVGGPVGGLGVDPLGRLVAEQHVQVGGVAQLGPAQLAHAQHGHPDRRRALAGLAHGHGQPRLQARLGEGGQLGPDALDREVAGEVAHGHPDQLAALEPPQPVPGRRRLVVPGHDRVRRRDQLGRPPDRGHPVLVGHGREQLGMAGQQVAEQPRGAEHGAEQLGRGRVVADHAVEGGPVAERLGQHPQRRQPAVGVGRLGQPGQHHRQHGPHQRGPPRQPRGEGAQRRHGPVGVGEPEGGQPLARPLRVEPGRDRPEGLQQRPVEQLLVEAADRHQVAAPVGLEPLQGVGVRPVPVAEGAGQPAPRLLPRRDGVGAALAGQLEAVLDQAQEPVGLGQLGGVGPADEPGGGEPLQGDQGRTGPQGRVVAAVDELEELDGELDVAQPARAELDLPVAPGPGLGRGLDPGLHAPHGRDRLRVEALGVHPGLGLGAEAPGQLGVAGHRPHLDQRLQLPRLGPPVPVGQVAAKGPRQRPVAALGTQVGVDLETGPLGGHRRQPAHDAPGHPLGRPGGRLRLGPGDRFVAEQHVDVGHVVELGPAELAHAEHGQAHRRRVVAGLAGRHRQGGLQAGVGQVGQLGRGLLDRDPAGQVAHGHPQQLAALEPPQPVPGGRRVGVGGDHRDRLGDQLGPGPGGGEPPPVGQPVGLGGVGGQPRPQRPAGRDQGDEAAPEPEPAPQQGGEAGRVGMGGGDRGQGPGRELGGGAGGDVGPQPVPAGGGGRRPRPEPLQVGRGRLRLLEAEPGQSGERHGAAYSSGR